MASGARSCGQHQPIAARLASAVRGAGTGSHYTAPALETRFRDYPSPPVLATATLVHPLPGTDKLYISQFIATIKALTLIVRGSQLHN